MLDSGLCGDSADATDNLIDLMSVDIEYFQITDSNLIQQTPSIDFIDFDE